MAGNMIYLIAFGGAALISYVAARLTIKLAQKTNILDQPADERKIHDQPIPLLGGLPIYSAVLLVVYIFWQLGWLLDSRIDSQLIFWLLVCGLILLINGIVDDKYRLPAWLTILAPIGVSLVMIWQGLEISTITNPGGGVLQLTQHLSPGLIWLIPLLTFLWLMGMTYTTKLLDGVDGLTSTIGLIASMVVFLVSLDWDIEGSTTSIMSLALAGALLGFLVLNWHPAKIFLGEAGSTMIGFFLGVLAIISGSKIATALLVMGLPLLDIVWVIVARIRMKRPFWQGDRQHLHFRLMMAGLTQRQVVLFYSGVSLLFGLVSIFFTTKAKIGALLFLVVLMIILSGWLNIKLRGDVRKA